MQRKIQKERHCNNISIALWGIEIIVCCDCLRRKEIAFRSSDANCNHKDNTEMPKKSTDYGLLAILIMI